MARVAERASRRVIRTSFGVARGALWSLLPGVAAFLVAGAVFAWELHGSVRAFFLGAYIVAILVLFAWGISVMANTTWQVRGIMGERATASTLAPRRARRRGWRIVHGLFFEFHGDVDHVLICPQGVWAVETKWTSEPAEVVDEQLVGPWARAPLDQAHDSARWIDHALRLTRARLDLGPRPMLVIWGPGAPGLDGNGRMVDGVLVLSCPSRKDVQRFLADGPSLDAATVQAAWKELSDLGVRQAKVRHPSARRPRP